MTSQTPRVSVSVCVCVCEEENLAGERPGLVLLSEEGLPVCSSASLAACLCE